MSALQRFITFIAFALLASCTHQGSRDEPQDAIASFCEQLSLQDHRNVNLKACKETGQLTENPQDQGSDRGPSSIGSAYTFRGKAMHHGLPITCSADRVSATRWNIKYCQNEK